MDGEVVCASGNLCKRNRSGEQTEREGETVRVWRNECVGTAYG